MLFKYQLTAGQKCFRGFFKKNGINSKTYAIKEPVHDTYMDTVPEIKRMDSTVLVTFHVQYSTAK